MKSSFSHRNVRRSAAVMLFVWLLALATGVANACLVQPEHARHGHPAHAEAQPGTTKDQAANHEHEASPASLACQSFCAAEQTGLPKSGGELLTPSGLLALAPGTAAWAAAPPSAAATLRPGRAHPPGLQPPVTIRFLRLTI